MVLVMMVLMVVQYIFLLSVTILPSPLTAVFLPNAKLVMVEHYFFHQIPPTSTSAVLASRITMLLVMEMTFVWILLLASTLPRAVVSIRRCARRLPWVIELIVIIRIWVNCRITVQKKRFDNLSFFFFSLLLYCL
jgi:hypothetical protein